MQPYRVVHPVRRPVRGRCARATRTASGAARTRSTNGGASVAHCHYRRDRGGLRTGEPIHRGGLGLHIVRANALEVVEVRRVHAARDVLAVEHGALEPLNRRVQLPHARDQVRQRLEDDQVRADRVRDLLRRPPVRDELCSRGHVDTVYVRVPDWRRA